MQTDEHRHPSLKPPDQANYRAHSPAYPDDGLDASRWYLIQSKPNEAKRAEQNLRNQRYECFLPTHRVCRQRCQRIYTRTEPLFPNYLFIRLSGHSNWRSVNSTRGVARVVAFNGRPTPVTDGLVAALRQRCVQDSEQPPEFLYQPGDTVRITQGCFRDIDAMVESHCGRERVVLLLELMQRQHRLTLPVEAVTGTG